MSDFYLDVCAEAVTLAVIAASVLSAVCWLTEMTLGRQIGVYAGYVAAPVVVLMIAREIHASLECYGVSVRGATRTIGLPTTARWLPL